MPNLLILFKDKQMIFLIQSTLRKKGGRDPRTLDFPLNRSVCTCLSS